MKCCDVRDPGMRTKTLEDQVHGLPETQRGLLSLYIEYSYNKRKSLVLVLFVNKKISNYCLFLYHSVYLSGQDILDTRYFIICKMYRENKLTTGSKPANHFIV
jgi:hypothetical protein